MSTVPHIQAYRKVVREVAKASISPPKTRSKTVPTNFRAIFEQGATKAKTFEYDMANAITFLESQRMYKTLLDRYNPLIDLTGEERIEATARRVGFNMPITAKDDDKSE